MSWKKQLYEDDETAQTHLFPCILLLFLLFACLFVFVLLGARYWVSNFHLILDSSEKL